MPSSELPLTARILGAWLRARPRAHPVSRRWAASLHLRGGGRSARAFVAGVCVVGSVACGDGSNSLVGPATSENVERTAAVWMLSGTPPALPAGFRFLTEQAVRPQMLPTGSLNFDLAVDFAADGRVQLLPARTVVPLPPAGGSLVGLQLSASTFETIQRAPETGYHSDSVVVVAPRQLVLVRIDGVGCLFGDPFYAKLVVDSIVAAERRVVVRTLVNRNCGYRALTTGLPKN